MFLCVLAWLLLASPCLADGDQLLEMKEFEAEEFDRNYVELLQLLISPDEKSQR